MRQSAANVGQLVTHPDDDPHRHLASRLRRHLRDPAVRLDHARGQKATSEGGVFVWLERHADDQLYALRQRGEELSDVILRLAGIEAAKPGRKRVRP